MADNVRTADCLIVGGGVIGLSIAYEMARNRQRVVVLERGQIGREASWAGAGLLPPANQDGAWDPQEQLRGLSHRLFPEWSRRLRQETGIDNEYEQTGGVHLARDPGEAAALRVACVEYEEEGIKFEPLDDQSLRQRFKHIDPPEELLAACYLPGEALVRNPRHLQALAAACRKRGVQLHEMMEIERWEYDGPRVQGVQASGKCFWTDRVCLAAGAWSQILADRMLDEHGFAGQIQRPHIEPIRGQLIVLEAAKRPFQSAINEGNRYLVPRRDGLVLVGATVEEAGFDKQNTPEAIEDLTRFAHELVPGLRNAPRVHAWSGLRPASVDRIPYLGRLPGLQNVFLAAGHYRSGLHLSPATAVVMSQLMLDEKPALDLKPFRVERG